MYSNSGNECCGLSEICDFPQGDWHYVRNTVVCVERELKQVIKTDRHYAFQIITLLDKQNDKYGKAVLRCGFKLVGECINSNTNNKLFMYVRPRVAPEKAAAKKKPMKRGTWTY